MIPDTHVVCAGIELPIADVVPTGLTYDRQFCFAEFVTPKNVPADASEEEKTPRWEFKTMRDGRFSRLALIRPEVWVPDLAARGYHPDLEEVKSGGVLVVRYPRTSNSQLWDRIIKLAIALHLCSPERSFRVPFMPSAEEMDNYPLLPVRLWKDSPMGFNYGHHLPTSLRSFLSPDSSSPPLALFRVSPAHSRPIFRNAPRKELLGFQPRTGFADAYPLHLLNIASVRDIAERCATAIPHLSVRRFRANIIIEGPPAYAEDSWKRILIVRDVPKSIENGQGRERGQEQKDGIEIHAACRTIRCRLPNVDPDTGVRHPSEPDKTLKSFRCIDAGDRTNACLGMQLVPSEEKFTIRVNDQISVLEEGEHFYIKMLKPTDPPV
ncbi:MOSC domain protein [Paecilomyces variotii No. 5]|uniref:MOSC domain protein n=1 Tax=Byssochlamys spectabilis (strain No. 5 / NBRC 109023) TaxID=1356009 RepID=V5GDL4_BYSSN|nr:MOSC domain protein [Paecilomyces variotii No. 5]